MNILFLHRDFPGQFKHIAAELAKNPANKVSFITDDSGIQLPGIRKHVYKPVQKISENAHPYLKNYIEAVAHGQSAASMALTLKTQGYKPDIIYGFSGWGSAMFMKDIFPDVPFLSYYEWFYSADGPEVKYSGIEFNDDDKARIRCKNSKFLIDLYSSDAGISPTEWQKSQFPKEFHDKIKVIHDGIDTEICKPNSEARFLIKDKNLELTVQDEVITYATRGLDTYRGFPQFMEMAEKLLKKRPNAHIVIAGANVSGYGQKYENITPKDYAIKKHKLDMNRVHFVDVLDYDEYLKLLQISTVHVYLTVPFVLSWSFLEAMSVGCCIVASNTQPVLEVMKNNYNGLLADFFSVEHIFKRVIYALENKKEMEKIRKNARQTIIDNYELKDMLKKQIEYINSLIKK